MLIRSGSSVTTTMIKIVLDTLATLVTSYSSCGEIVKLMTVVSRSVTTESIEPIFAIKISSSNVPMKSLSSKSSLTSLLVKTENEYARKWVLYYHLF